MRVRVHKFQYPKTWIALLPLHTNNGFSSEPAGSILSLRDYRSERVLSAEWWAAPLSQDLERLFILHHPKRKDGCKQPQPIHSTGLTIQQRFKTSPKFITCQARCTLTPQVTLAARYSISSLKDKRACLPFPLSPQHNRQPHVVFLPLRTSLLRVRSLEWIQDMMQQGGSQGSGGLYRY